MIRRSADLLCEATSSVEKTLDIVAMTWGSTGLNNEQETEGTAGRNEDQGGEQEWGVEIRLSSRENLRISGGVVMILWLSA